MYDKGKIKPHTEFTRESRTVFVQPYIGLAIYGLLLTVSGRRGRML